MFEPKRPLVFFAVTFLSFCAAYPLLAEEKSEAPETPLVILESFESSLQLLQEHGVPFSFRPTAIGLKVSGPLKSEIDHSSRIEEPELGGEIWRDLLIEEPYRRAGSTVYFTNDADLLYEALGRAFPGARLESLVYLLYVSDLPVAEKILAAHAVPFLRLDDPVEVVDPAEKEQYTYACHVEGYSDTCCTGFLCGLFTPYQTCNNAVDDCCDSSHNGCLNGFEITGIAEP